MSFLLLEEEVVYLLIPTSNHNNPSYQQYVHQVVYLLIPTSNHNYDFMLPEFGELFIS